MSANPNPAGRIGPFRDRVEAGRILAAMLSQYANRPDVIVLALPRGGAPVGYEVARALNVSFDLLVVRKLGVPGQEELAMGAISSGGTRVVNHDVVRALGISDETIESVAVRELSELERRERAYRGARPAPDVGGRTVILVDDGLATGSTMRAAVAAVRARMPRSIVIAVPVAAPVACNDFRGEVDQFVCPRTPEQFYAVGLWYQDFSEVSDEEIRELLDRAAAEHPAEAR